MKTKLYRRVGGKHVKFNISKSGVSTSIKLGPITINPQRNTYSINTPIKGLSLRGKLDEGIKNNQQEAENIERAEDIELQKVNTGIVGRIALTFMVAMATFALVDSGLLSIIIIGILAAWINHPFIAGFIAYLGVGKLEENFILDNIPFIVIGIVVLLLVANVLLH